MSYLCEDRLLCANDTVQDLGLLHAIPLPAHVFFDVFLNYTLNPCELEIVHVYAQVPSDLLGIFIDIATGISPTPEAP